MWPSIRRWVATRAFTAAVQESIQFTMQEGQSQGPTWQAIRIQENVEQWWGGIHRLEYCERLAHCVPCKKQFFVLSLTCSMTECDYEMQMYSVADRSLFCRWAYSLTAKGWPRLLSQIEGSSVAMWWLYEMNRPYWSVQHQFSESYWKSSHEHLQSKIRIGKHSILAESLNFLLNITRDKHTKPKSKKGTVLSRNDLGGLCTKRSMSLKAQ